MCLSNFFNCFFASFNSKPIIFHDKNEDGHYDLLSAFQKSIRGSDVDAALHYLARLIEARGEAPNEIIPDKSFRLYFDG